MRRMLTFVPALLVGVSLILTDGVIASMPHQGVVDGSMVWEVGASSSNTAKKKKNKKTTPVRNTGNKKKPPVKAPAPSGAAAATQGQSGRCICSTNAQGSMTCTGNCQ